MVPPGEKNPEKRPVQSGKGVFGNNFVKMVARRLRIGVKMNIVGGVRKVINGEKRNTREKVDEGHVRV